jgi:peptidoglycan/LPS O-acetylase OafA/YrhL
MGRWPPLIWLLVSVGSLLLLIGVGGDWNPAAFFPGAAAVVLGFGLAMHLAYGRRDVRRRAKGTSWLVALAAGFYAVCVAITAFAGTRYALAAAGAALVPLTAAALLVATHGRKHADGARDPYPGIASDQKTPVGDTDQHSDARA